MRPFLWIIAVLLVPVLTLVHRYQYYRTMKSTLEAQVKAILASDPAFSEVKASVNHLDVTLENTVPDVAARDRLRRLIDGLPGLRCRPQDNHLAVPAVIEGKVEGETMTLSGLLHDPLTLREIAQWLKSSRPGLQVSTEGVAITPYAVQEGFHPAQPLSPMLHSLLTAIEAHAALKIIRTESGFKLQGYLPDEALRGAVSEALLVAGNSPVDSTAVRVGSFVKPASFTQPEALPEFLKRYFGLPESVAFEATENSVRFSADITTATYAEWRPILAKLCDERGLRASVHLYPSIYHLPAYRPQSKLEPAALATLQEALRRSVLQFEPKTTDVSGPDRSKIGAVVQAIIAAGPEARIVVGGYGDPPGDTKASLTLAKRRADVVVAEFVDRGVPAARLEAGTFLPGSAGAAVDSHKVEMRVK